MDILPGSRDRRSAQLREEIQTYLEERVAELRAEGLSEEDAWSEAHKAFGDIEAVEAQVHAVHEGTRRKGSMRDTLSSPIRDARNALRGLARAPGFTLIALITLALGLGANTAVYSLVHAALFRAPPVRAPDGLIALYTTSRRGFPRSSTSYPDFLDYRERGTTLEGLAATSTLPASLGHDERGSRFLAIQAVTGNYFDLVGAPVIQGRALGVDDDAAGAGRPVVVLSHELWQEHFLGDPGILGTDVRLNGSPFTVVGDHSPGLPRSRAFVPTGRMDHHAGRAPAWAGGDRHAGNMGDPGSPMDGNARRTYGERGHDRGGPRAVCQDFPGHAGGVRR